VVYTNIIRDGLWFNPYSEHASSSSIYSLYNTTRNVLVNVKKKGAHLVFAADSIIWIKGPARRKKVFWWRIIIIYYIIFVYSSRCAKTGDNIILPLDTKQLILHKNGDVCRYKNRSVLAPNELQMREGNWESGYDPVKKED